MIPDPNDEILAIKRRLAAQFDNDVHRIAADVRKRQGDSGHEVISLEPRRCTPSSTTNNAVNGSGESGGA
jgi:hypothetical protein